MAWSQLFPVRCKDLSFMVSENDSAVGLSDPSKEPPKEVFFQAIFALSLVNQIRSSIMIVRTLLSGSCNQIRSSIMVFQTLCIGSCNQIRFSTVIFQTLLSGSFDQIRSSIVFSSNCAQRIIRPDPQSVGDFCECLENSGRLSWMRVTCNALLN